MATETATFTINITRRDMSTDEAESKARGFALLLGLDPKAVGLVEADAAPPAPPALASLPLDVRLLAGDPEAWSLAKVPTAESILPDLTLDQRVLGCVRCAWTLLRMMEPCPTSRSQITPDLVVDLRQRLAGHYHRFWLLKMAGWLWPNGEAKPFDPVMPVAYVVAGRSCDDGRLVFVSGEECTRHLAEATWLDDFAGAHEDCLHGQHLVALREQAMEIFVAEVRLVRVEGGEPR